MNHRGRGYTIIEVMIVLGITGLLFTSAVMIFEGQQDKTFLSQSLYGLASELQTYASEVNAGVYGDSNNYSCAVTSGQPVLTYQGSGFSGGSQQDCIFLGRAIQVKTGSDQLTSYTALGTRDYWSGSQDTGNTAQTFDQAGPEMAMDSGGQPLLTNVYNLPSGQTFTASKVTDQAGNSYNNYDLVGLYLDLEGGGNSTTSLNIRGYNSQNSDTLSVKSCIEQSGPCSTYVDVRSWRLCVKNGPKVGSITVTTTASGIATSVDAEECL